MGKSCMQVTEHPIFIEMRRVKKSTAHTLVLRGRAEVFEPANARKRLQSAQIAFESAFKDAVNHARRVQQDEGMKIQLRNALERWAAASSPKSQRLEESGVKEFLDDPASLPAHDRLLACRKALMEIRRIQAHVDAQRRFPGSEELRLHLNDNLIHQMLDLVGETLPQEDVFKLTKGIIAGKETLTTESLRQSRDMEELKAHARFHPLGFQDATEKEKPQLGKEGRWWRIEVSLQPVESKGKTDAPGKIREKMANYLNYLGFPVRHVSA